MARGDGRAARRGRQLRQARGLAGRDRCAAVAVGRPASGRARRGPQAAVAGRDPASLVRDRRAAGVRDGLAAGGAAGTQAAPRPDAPGARVRRRGAGQAGRPAERRRVERLRSRAGVRPPGPHPQGPLRGRRPRDRPGGRTAPVASHRSLSGRLRRGPSRDWLGINAVALLSREEARAVRPDAGDEARRLAAAIQAGIQHRDPAYDQTSTARQPSPRRSWLSATPASAVQSLVRYVQHPKVNGFALGSTLRQFVEIWCLDRGPEPGPQIVNVLRAAAMEHLEGAVKMSPGDIRRAREAMTGGRHEAVFGLDRFDSIENYRRGLERSANVARIGRSVGDRRRHGLSAAGRARSTRGWGGVRAGDQRARGQPSVRRISRRAPCIPPRR